ncbi:hypothetical protein GC194_07105 [bacterium]|nr:hypothetical protein [bacterium]
MNENKQIKPVLVTGSHRSGSTWVGQVLSQVPHLGYMHEPLNPIYPTPRKSPIDIWYLYISAHNHAQYHAFFEKTLQWNYQALGRLGGVNNLFKAKMWLKYLRIFNQNKGTTPLMKDPIALFSAPWLAQNFNMQVVVLIRHPAAFVYSLVRKDWKFPFGHLWQQKELIHDYLGDYAPQIEAFSKEEKPIVEQACLVWRLFYHTVRQYMLKFPDWQYIKHEDLSLEPTEKFKNLFEQLNLEYSPQVAEFVKNSSDSDNPGGTTGSEEQMQRNSKANISYWKNKLSTEEIERIKELTSDIWPHFYTPDDW